MKFNLRRRPLSIMLKLKTHLQSNSQKERVMQNTYSTSKCRQRLQLIMAATKLLRCRYAHQSWITSCKRMGRQQVHRPSRRRHVKLQWRGRYGRLNMRRRMTKSSCKRANRLIPIFLEATICGAASSKWSTSPESPPGRQISSHLRKYSKPRETLTKPKNRGYGWRYWPPSQYLKTTLGCTQTASQQGPGIQNRRPN